MHSILNKLIATDVKTAKILPTESKNMVTTGYEGSKSVINYGCTAKGDLSKYRELEAIYLFIKSKGAVPVIP
ncbi:MAG: hypothetical protein MRQ13_04965 [Candidatus Midichloria sp.]|nr:hypothetical protein [Candidatus Midichloria sp.]